jgi:hypothetical protein
MTISSCKDCVPPERHPGCHSKCEKYLQQKAAHDALREADYKRRRTRNNLIAQRTELYDKAMKNRRTKDR